MSKAIKNLENALSYELLGLLYAENKLSTEFRSCSQFISSAEVKSLIKSYVGNGPNIKLKLDRIFNYLMIEPVGRKNEVINKMIDETHHLLNYAGSAHLKDILMIGCIKNINTYKTSCYQSSYLMSVELGLDNVADLIHQILEWETSTGKSLNELAISEFNRINEITNLNEN